MGAKSPTIMKRTIKNIGLDPRGKIIDAETEACLNRTEICNSVFFFLLNINTEEAK